MKIKIIACYAIIFNTCTKANWQERAKNILQFFSWEGQLLWSVRFARKEYINWLCTKVGDINATDRHKRTALIRATQSNRKETVQVLISKRALINKQDSDGNTALHYSHCEIARMITENESESFLLQNNSQQFPEETIYNRQSGRICAISSPLPTRLETDAYQKKNLLETIKLQRGSITREDVLEWERSCQLSSSNSSRMTSSLNNNLEDNSRNFE